MAQGSLFDYKESKRLRDEGMAIAADNRPTLLAVAKATAVELGLGGRPVDMDMVRALMHQRGQNHEGLGNAAGSVFKPTRDWELVGYSHSSRPAAHTHTLRRWRLAR
jgi:hypothetical protein